jgi:hypothetical protein
MAMGICLDNPRRDWSFDSKVYVVSTGPAADRQAKCLSM